MLVATEQWIIAELERVLGDRVRTVESAPARWSDEYVRRRLIPNSLPAFFVVWQGMRPEGSSTDLNVLVRWAVLVVTGFDAMGERARRHGDDHAAGAWPLLEGVVTTLHNCRVRRLDEAGEVVLDEGRLRVVDVQSLYQGRLEKRQISVCSVEIEQKGQLDPEASLQSLDDYARAGVEWALTEEADRADLTDEFEIPQGG